MPNTKSAMKRQRQTAKKTVLNKTRKSRITTARRKLLSALQVGDTTKAESAYKEFCSALDKGAKAGVITTNRADRSKARATKAMAKAAE